MPLSESRMNRLRELETETRATLETLAHRVARLCPDHRDPHKFHEDKSDLAHELLLIARRMF